MLNNQRSTTSAKGGSASGGKFQDRDPFPDLGGASGKVKTLTGAQTWVEDVYGEGAWTPHDAPVVSEFIGLAAKRRRVIFFSLCLAGLLAVLWGRTGYLMAQSGSFKLRSDQNRIRTIYAPAPRGVIYDRNGVQLTDNVPDLQLAVVPADLPTDEVGRREAIAKIAGLANIDPVEAEKAINEFGPKGYQPVTVAANITRDQAVDLTIAKQDEPAIRIVNGSHRFYGPANTVMSLAHLLGYMGRVTAADLKNTEAGDYQPSDSIGRTGLEASYEKELRGRPGVKKVEVDALGNEVRVVGEEDQTLGSDLHLTIDVELTAAAEAALRSAMAGTHLKRGAVVVEDVGNGEILSLISLPSYSNNRFAEGISQSEYKQLNDDPDNPLFNRAVSGTYPPGSTVKLIVASAALAEGIITPATTVNSTGGILYGGKWWFPDWKAGGHGITNVRRAIAWSVNTFFYMIGGGYESFAGLGIEKLDEYFQLFGLGKVLGIDIPNEAAGFVPTPEWKESAKNEVWYIGDTYHVSIGQGDLLVTPLQMTAWTAAVANGGTLWRPHLAQGAPVAIRSSIVRNEYLATVRAGARDTVLSGSAQPLAGVSMKVAGKTGTAQASGKGNHAWFTGFGPYDDPQIAVTVLIEEGGEGSLVAVPVARDIFEWWAKNRLDADRHVR